MRSVNRILVQNEASYPAQFVKKLRACPLTCAQKPSLTVPCYAGSVSPDVLLCDREGCQTRSMLAVVKPSPLRLWGFLLTVLGGTSVTFGSIGNWATVTLGESTLNAVPTKGIDLWQGKATAILGLVIIAGILALRFVRPDRRRLVAFGLIAFAMVALGLAVWCLAAAGTVVADAGVDALVKMVVEQLGLSNEEARRQVLTVMDTAGIEVRAQVGLWTSLIGASLAVAGGFVDLVWVRHKRFAGDAIDPDTLPERPAEPPRRG